MTKRPNLGCCVVLLVDGLRVVVVGLFLVVETLGVVVVVVVVMLVKFDWTTGAEVVDASALTKSEGIWVVVEKTRGGIEKFAMVVGVTRVSD